MFHKLHKIFQNNLISSHQYKETKQSEKGSPHIYLIPFKPTTMPAINPTIALVSQTIYNRFLYSSSIKSVILSFSDVVMSVLLFYFSCIFSVLAHIFLNTFNYLKTAYEKQYNTSVILLSHFYVIFLSSI